MYQIIDEDVFNSNSTILVNAINIIGIMGSGIALEFKNRYPDMYLDYIDKFRNRQLQIGKPYLYKNIYNFPTKKHWKDNSKLEWIEEGLQHFTNTYQELGITSIAFPKLGCGKGSLNWNEVQDLMIKHFTPLENIDIKICLAKNQKF